MFNQKLALSGLIVATAAATLIQAPLSHAAALPDSIQFQLNRATYTNNTGKHPLTVSPYQLNNTSMVPLRPLAESFGTAMSWNQGSHSASLSGSFGKITFKANSNIAINGKGEQVKLPQQAKLVKGNLFVPARSLAELTGVKLDWVPSTRTITLTAKNAIPATRMVSYSFNKDNEGWKGGFADLPVNYDKSIYELEHVRALLPVAEKNPTNYALKLQGHNRSDDLFMYLSRNVDGFVPNTTYEVKLQFGMYTDQAGGMAGIGGAPGESVIVKTGILDKEPLAIPTPGKDSMYRMNVDKGNQSVGGKDVKVLGNITKPDSAKEGFQRVDFSYSATVKSNAKGQLYLLIGVDSGFEGLTTLYFDDIKMTAVQK
ncbi:hypothetical protein A8L34_15575 [Bacillus sp. FJAT-27264]|uniref:stalk domain-containing protein n=1 Tax=Paenibacillus sp. (strain DSM 101736 / FJAT-27264) TaxID=1850362 RepID=UPI000807F923|nr:stalk domain-containing protein [Bacillus sp. FJAT-27264]OBZ11757.1 hypothetical protein A8L34_15575 [Bacillus sp. FJAT-27264]